MMHSFTGSSWKHTPLVLFKQAATAFKEPTLALELAEEGCAWLVSAKLHLHRRCAADGRGSIPNLHTNKNTSLKAGGLYCCAEMVSFTKAYHCVLRPRNGPPEGKIPGDARKINASVLPERRCSPLQPTSKRLSFLPTSRYRDCYHLLTNLPPKPYAVSRSCRVLCSTHLFRTLLSCLLLQNIPG